jgi:hypothetical protein
MECILLTIVLGIGIVSDEPMSIAVEDCGQKEHRYSKVNGGQEVDVIEHDVETGMYYWKDKK